MTNQNLNTIIMENLVGKPTNIKEVIKDTQLNQSEIELLSNKVINIDNNSKIINDNVYLDLEMFHGNNNEPNNSIFNILDNTYTQIGKNQLKNIISNPIKDIQVLESRQTIINSLLKSKDLPKINEYLSQLKKLETEILWFWKDITPETDQLLDMVYFKMNILKRFNENEQILQFYNYFKIIFAPVYGILSPVLLFVMPFLYIKFFTNFKITFKIYFKLLKSSMFNLPFGSPFGGGGSRSKISKYISIFMSIMFYIQNIYSSFEIAMNTNKIINELHVKINKVREFLDISNKLHELTKVIFNVPTLTKLKITELWNPLFKTDPSIYSNKGKILITFNKLLNNKHDLLEYIKYISKIDAYISIVKLFQTTDETKCNYSLCEYINSKKPLIKANDIWNPVINPNNAISNNIKIGGNKPNNIIITGPNAGGKSTIIKSITLSLLLGQTIGIVPAKEFKFTPFSLINTYLNIPDHKGKESLFESEMRRAKGHIDNLNKLPKTHFSFVVMDEIFSSTNPDEGMSGGYAIGERLGNYENSISLITTHYAYLTKLEDAKTYCNYKIPIERDESGEIIYPYKLKPGISNQYIALELLKNKGFDNKLVDRAIDVCQEITSKMQKDRKSISSIIKKKMKKKSHSSDSDSSKHSNSESPESLNKITTESDKIKPTSILDDSAQMENISPEDKPNESIQLDNTNEANSLELILSDNINEDKLLETL